VREALREVLPRVHGGVLGDEGLPPALGRAIRVVTGDRVAVADRLVAEDAAALNEIFTCARTGFDENIR
jgi:hypothetical protein